MHCVPAFPQPKILCSLAFHDRNGHFIKCSFSLLLGCMCISLPEDLLLSTCRLAFDSVTPSVPFLHCQHFKLVWLVCRMSEPIKLLAQLFLCGLRLSLWATSKRVARSRCAISWIWERKKIICWKIHDCVGKKPNHLIWIGSGSLISKASPFALVAMERQDLFVASSCHPASR